MNARWLCIGALCLLGACGFHLRTWELGESVTSASVAATGRNFMEEPLKRNLRATGVDLLEPDEAADIRIDLLEERRGRRSVSVTDQARAAEYEIAVGVLYSVTAKDGKVLVEPRWIQTQRIYRVDRDNIVGSSEEQALLEREMINDLVQQMLRSLNTVTRELPVAA